MNKEIFEGNTFHKDKREDKKMKLNWKVIGKKTGTVLAFAGIAIIGFSQYKQEQLVEGLSSKILRFHVLANSDSKVDQELKLKVRDAVGGYMQQELEGISDLEESRKIVLAEMKNIEKTAKKVIQEEGYSYEVTASLANVDFPEKTYGTYTFPEGEYEALQVVIGDGNGQNWWCVMYPNMCFFNSMYEVVEEEADKSLQRALTTEEYQAIMEDGKYEVKFKFLSFLND